MIEASDEAALLGALRAGEEAAFAALVDRYHARLVRVARLYVGEPAVAEEVAQETWLAALNGLGRFEGRSSLKTWLFAILTNRAKTRALREQRSLPFSALEAGAGELAVDEPTVEPERFRAEGQAGAGHWSQKPANWESVPEARLLAAETQATLQRAIAALPPVQAAVLRLRDIDHLTTDEICNVLGLSETNQRVLLHRARAKVRRALEDYFAKEF